MAKFEIEIPEAIFNQALEKYKSRKKVEDILSARLEVTIRKDRSLMIKQKFVKKTLVNIYLRDNLLPFFNDMLVRQGKSKNDYIIKMLKRLNK